MRIPILNIEITAAGKNKVSNALPDESVRTKTVKDKNGVSIPISGGRSSVPDNGGTFISSLIEELSIMPAEFHLDLLQVLENLAKYNPDVSYAIDNVVQLGNTDYDIFFDDSVSEAQAEEMIGEIKQAQQQWYAYSGGINSLRNDLLVQAVLNGCISGEIVPHNNLDGVKKIVLVSPKNVRFVYDSKADEYKPYQQLKNWNGVKDTSAGTAGMKELNTTTYKYYAMRRFNESPYGIPPFLSALENLAMEKSMMSNFKAIVEKFGVLGFMTALIAQPTQGTMTDDEYKRALEAHLYESASEVEKGISKGYVVGYKDQHEFKMENTTANMSGSQTFFKLNNEMKMSGLKQDPLMLGRNYSTTETLARVIISKFTAQLANYQNVVDKFMADAMTLHLLLKGYKFGYVQVESKKPMLNDQKSDAETEKINIENQDALVKQGVISHTQRAQALGYDKPFSDEPLDMSPAEDTSPEPVDQDPTIQPNMKDMIAIAELSLTKGGPAFDYSHDHSHHGREVSELRIDADLIKFFNKYAKEIKGVYAKGIKKVTKKIANEISQLGAGSSYEQVLDKVFYTLYNNWGNDFGKETTKYINRWVKDSYIFFRKDKSMFVNPKDIPDAVFSLKDYRAIEHLTKSDSLYLGRFITDADTKKKITAFVKEMYFEKGLAQNSAEQIRLFRDQFENLMELEDWKISRILNTTVSKVRTYSAASYMDQAGVESFKVVGVRDRLQCPYCQELNGRAFTLKPVLKKLDNLYASDPELLKVDTPFVTAVYKDASDMKNLTSAELQANGIDLPPYHGNCRCTLVAVL